MLALIAGFIGAVGGTWMFIHTLYSQQPVVWPTSTVVAVGLLGGIVVGLIVGVVHRRRSRS